MSDNLWPHQEAAVASAVRTLQEGGDRGLWVMPTGAGKTRAFASLAQRLAYRTLVVVHRDELVQQTVGAFNLVWPGAAVGVVQMKDNDWDGPQVVVATVQTLSRRDRLGQIPPHHFGLVVVDEAHHATASSWSRILGRVEPRFLLGVTATPGRHDGKRIGVWFGRSPIYEYGLRQAIEDGVLARVRQYGVRTAASLDDVGVYAGDFSVKQLAETVNTPRRNQAVVDAYLGLVRGRPTIVFGADVSHVQALRLAFGQASVPAAAVVGDTPLDDRRRILADFRSGGYEVLVACQVLTEGYDEKRIAAVVMARPTMSRSLYQQAVGRGFRADREGGKEDCLVIDVLDRYSKRRVVTASRLFDAFVPDCGGEDVLLAADQDRVLRTQYPLTPTPAQEARWELGEETRWQELPSLVGYQPTVRWHAMPATKKQIRLIARYGLEPTRSLTRGEASHLIEQCDWLDRQYPTPPTEAQKKMLSANNEWRDGMTKHQAQRAVGRVMVQRRPGRRAG